MPKSFMALIKSIAKKHNIDISPTRPSIRQPSPPLVARPQPIAREVRPQSVVSQPRSPREQPENLRINPDLSVISPQLSRSSSLRSTTSRGSSGSESASVRGQPLQVSPIRSSQRVVSQPRSPREQPENLRINPDLSVIPPQLSRSSSLRSTTPRGASGSESASVRGQPRQISSIRSSREQTPRNKPPRVSQVYQFDEIGQQAASSRPLRRIPSSQSNQAGLIEPLTISEQAVVDKVRQIGIGKVVPLTIEEENLLDSANAKISNLAQARRLSLQAAQPASSQNSRSGSQPINTSLSGLTPNDSGELQIPSSRSRLSLQNSRSGSQPINTSLSGLTPNDSGELQIPSSRSRLSLQAAQPAPSGKSISSSSRVVEPEAEGKYEERELVSSAQLPSIAVVQKPRAKRRTEAERLREGQTGVIDVNTLRQTRSAAKQ